MHYGLQIDLDVLLEKGLGAVTSPILGGWAPGNRPAPLPKGTGIRIPKGAGEAHEISA